MQTKRWETLLSSLQRPRVTPTFMGLQKPKYMVIRMQMLLLFIQQYEFLRGSPMSLILSTSWEVGTHLLSGYRNRVTERYYFLRVSNYCIPEINLNEFKSKCCDVCSFCSVRGEIIRINNNKKLQMNQVDPICSLSKYPRLFSDMLNIF